MRVSPKRASIGLAVMARDAADTLPKLLKSVRPYVEQIVVGVDELTTDKTAKAAAKGGADEVFRLHVSDWHECPEHGRVLAQHFANARQETFSHLSPALDFWLWLDSDDVLQGAERLSALCEGIPADSAGAWFAYEYASITRADGQHAVNTLFHRERLLRTHRADGTPITWTWEGRVHETVKPHIDLPWLVAEDIRVVHQPGVHQTPNSAKRNLLLLEMDYEEDAGSPRTLFYLGNQHFAMGNWAAAAHWYEQLTLVGQNPYELWQAYLYMSYAYERLGDLTEATRAAFAAMDVVPQHGEPYFRLAALNTLAGDYQKALWWDEQGGTKTKPPFFVFKNPLDYTFHRYLVRGDALANMGRITEARQTWEQAEKVFVDDALAGALAGVRKKEADMTTAQAFVDLSEKLPESIRLGIYQGLDPDVKAFGRTRDIVVPRLMTDMRARLSADTSGTFMNFDGKREFVSVKKDGGVVRAGDVVRHRIIFWCGKALEPWAPPVLNTTGIGGSETAVIEIAKRFAADGWTVDVFNEAERYEGIYEGVGYWDCNRLTKDAACEIFVSWRQPAAWRLPIQANTKVLWCHDLNYGPEATDDVAVEKWHHILGVSDWHAEKLAAYYGLFGLDIRRHRSSQFDFVPNGIDLARFDPTIRKIPFRCVYASSPDRGLARLLDLWPQVTAAEPMAELHVGYGWENVDRMIAMGRTDLIPMRDGLAKKIAATPGVVWRGRLPQDELARLYGESVVWAYPTDFLEVSCISAMEAMAGGAIPVATKAGALPETIGDAGFLIPGPATTRAYADMWPKAVLGALTELNIQAAYRMGGRERAQAFTWDAAYEKWQQVLGLGEKRTNGVAEHIGELVTA
jgi:glycosyltransferase involved in cell wall biosynthesis/tetratricopeptide (TPR) repeat protein